MKKFHLVSALMLFASCFGLSAQTETIYERGATYLENTVPPSPEPASIVKYADVPFTHSTGMAEYAVPFYTLQGREMSIPIILHYASGGIKLDEIAGVAGLGWTLQAGGCITRTIMDMPDEYEPLIGPFRHEMPSGDLLDDLEDNVSSNETLTFLRDLVWNRIDVGLDRYSYSICGLSGSFVINDDGDVFQLSGDGVLIDYVLSEDGSVDEFIITGPDGTVYTLSLKEIASRDGRGMESVGAMNGKLDEWTAPTAWHLTSMRSRSGLETALFTYSEAETWDRSVSTRSETLTATCGYYQGEANSSISYGSVSSTYETRVLTGITLGMESVSFTYSKGSGNAFRTSGSPSLQNFPFHLTSMSVRVDDNDDEICRMIVDTRQDSIDGRVVLAGLELYKDGNIDDKWSFTYKGVGKRVSAGSQDWYGYYNGENEFTDDGNLSICPYEAELLGEGTFNLTNGFPNAKYASYMSLVSVDHDGAVSEYTYEGNTFMGFLTLRSIGVRVKNITLPGDSFKPVRVRYFTYEEPFVCGPKEPAPQMYCTVSMDIPNGGMSEECTWRFTMHETPVTLGPSIRDSRVYYGRVREDVTDQQVFQLDGPAPDENTSRTIYEYSMEDVYPYGKGYSGRFPDLCDELWTGVSAHALCGIRLGIQDYYNNSGPSVSPILTRREEYAFREGSYELVSSTDYEYDEMTRNAVLVDYYAVQAYSHRVDGYMEYDHIFHFPIYAHGNYGKHPVKETHVGYHQSGNDTTVVNKSYMERLSLDVPVRISAVSMTEGKVHRQMDYRYADNWYDNEGWIQELKGQHFLSTPILKGLTFENTTSGTLPVAPPVVRPSALDIEPTPFPNFPVGIDADKEEMTEFDWFVIDGEQYLLPSAHVEYNFGEESWRETILTRDSKGNISSLKEKGQPQAVILWSYGGFLPVAVIHNASIEEVRTALGGQGFVAGLTSAEAPSPDDLDRLAQLRTSLPQAHVTIYTHRPGIGVESISDPAGLLTTFEYEGGRLVCVRDNDGHKMEEYEYELMTDDNGRRHMHHKVFRSNDGQLYSEDVNWWDSYGRKTQDIAVAASGNGSDLVTAYESDFMLHDDVKIWLPYPAQSTCGDFQTDAVEEAESYHGNQLAYSLRNYELSSRDRIISEALPGYAGDHETSYIIDVADQLCNYRWENGKIKSLFQYAPDEVVVNKVTDADGRTTSTYRDHSGKTLATANGDAAPTYYVYDIYDRLRAVKSSGIAVTDTLNMWRYDYDSLGRLSSKGIPGSVREYYTYDEEDRLVSVLRDGVLKEMEYDAFGRVVKVWIQHPGEQRVLYEEHTYDIYPSGMTGSNPKGKKTQSRIAVIAPNSNVTGYTKFSWSYDAKGRPVTMKTRYVDGSEQVEELEYTFSGEVASIVTSYIHRNQCDELAVDYTYDIRGRLTKETAILTVHGTAPQIAEVAYGYDALGRLANKLSSTPGGKMIHATSSFALQGWQTGLSVTLDGRLLFNQALGYDGQESLAAYQPQYSGLVSVKEEVWFPTSGPTVNDREWYTYDYAGRLANEYSSSKRTAYSYDVRGNLLEAMDFNPSSRIVNTYVGDRLMSMRQTSSGSTATSEFTYDNLGRMTSDGQVGQLIMYNDLDLIGKITKNGTTLVNYSYLVDGTKLSALKDSGEGLVYRGPFVYRKSAGPGNSSLTLESASFGGGRLTPSGAMLYVTDYLGSVRAVVDGQSGELYKASDYSAFGEENDVVVPQHAVITTTQLATATLPDGTTIRDSYTGKEDQSLDFGTGYIDFGARQYNPSLRRWMIPDPLSEKYYGISPYTFCNNNPVNLVDLDGRYIEKGSRREWNNNKRILQEKIEGLQHQVSMLEGVENSSDIVDALNQQIAGIKQTLSTMKVLKRSTQGYKLSTSNSPLGQVRLDTESGLIDIVYISEDIGNFVHEVTHAGQYESGDIGFSDITGKVFAQDIYDEVEAYKAQACYVGDDPKIFTKQYVQNMPDASGNMIYAPFGSGRVAPVKVTVRSPLYHVHAAYGLPPTQSILPFYRATSMRYK